jgi:hypothetical protein
MEIDEFFPSYLVFQRCEGGVKALKGREDFHPDATSARLETSPDGPK